MKVERRPLYRSSATAGQTWERNHPTGAALDSFGECLPVPGPPGASLDRESALWAGSGEVPSVKEPVAAPVAPPASLVSSSAAAPAVVVAALGWPWEGGEAASVGAFPASTWTGGAGGVAGTGGAGGGAVGTGGTAAPVADSTTAPTASVASPVTVADAEGAAKAATASKVAMTVALREPNGILAAPLDRSVRQVMNASNWLSLL
jgi:hypothetical protein